MTFWGKAIKTGPEGSLAQHFGWMFAGQGAGYLLRAAYFVLIARLLGATQYGVLVGAIALVNMVTNYGRLGSSIVFIRHVSADRAQFAIYWGHILLVTIGMGSILVVLLRLVAGRLIGASSAALIVPTAIASCLCEQLTVGAGQVFQTFQKMHITATLNLLTSLVRTLTAAVMLIVMHRATGLQWSYASAAVSAAAAIAAATLVVREFGAPEFVPRLFLKRGVEGVEYAISASADSAYNDLDKTMLSHYGMSAANGIYTMAYRAIDLAAIPMLSLNMAAEPRLFQLGAIGVDRAAEFGRKLLKRSLPMGAVAGVGLFILAPLIPVILGKDFSESVSALRWLCLIPLFRTVHVTTGNVLTSVGLQRYRTVAQIAAVGINFVLNLWLIPHHGWRGAAWASLATDGALGLINWSALEWLLSRPRVRVQA